MWSVFLVNGLLPFATVAPFVPSLVEAPHAAPPKITDQAAAIWALVQRRAVWRPCCFIYIYNALLLTNPAWNSFLVEVRLT